MNHWLFALALLLALSGAVAAPGEAVTTGVLAAAAKTAPQFSTAGFFAVPGSPRQVVNFNPGWRFRKADVSGAEKTGFDDGNWEGASLPHSLEILGENASGCRNYQGPAWYRKRFQVSTLAPGQKIYVYFEGVMGKCAVWLNGRKVAEHFGGYLPFAAEISGQLQPDGKDNVMAVRADNADDPTYPPGKPQCDLDFTYLGGIYRDVYLIKTAPVHVTLTELSPTAAGGGVFVGVKDIKGQDASLEVRTEIANDTATPQEITLRTVLETSEGNEILKSDESVTMAPGASREVIQPLEAKNAHLWQPDDPCLHFIRTEVSEQGKVLDSLRTRFGIRLFEMRGKEGLFVNKKPFLAKLSGVNRHQDYTYVGNALPNSGQWRDAKLLREGGCNVIRAAHYPPDPAFMDACDELGLLVTSANPGWQFFNDKDAVFEQRLYEDTRNLVRRDRNRPAVLLWETVINETPEQPERTLKGMNQTAHREYPFPGMFTVGDIPEARKGGLDFYYAGNEVDQETNPSSEAAKNSFRREYGDGEQVDNFYSHNAPVRVRRDWGEAALLGQAMIRAQDLDEIVYDTPRAHLGAALWCGIDHQRGYHPDPFWGGLLDGFRLPRYSYYLFKSQYDPGYKVPGIETGPMLYIAHELTQISGSDVVIFCNCEEVRLRWLDKVLGPRKPDAGYHNLPHPPFTFTNAFDFREVNGEWRMRTRQMEMVAEGLIGGKVVVREVKKYPERTTGIQVTVDDLGLGLTADGSDFVPVRATIVDNKGVPKVLAAEDIHFEVEGPADIIGGAFNQANPMRTEFGTATALIRARTTPGDIKVVAYSKGLVAGQASLVSTAPALPLEFDGAYAAASKPPAEGGRLAGQTGNTEIPVDSAGPETERVTQQREVTSKQQELMELRTKLGQ
ncbi:MAG: glycoside hydrolase family 2 TIM barrel-domain containing protein [Verrucomicrobiota bacterium]